MKKSRVLPIVTSVLTVAALSNAPVISADLTLSGQVTPAIVFGSNIEDPEIVDNTGTGSRLRLRGKHKARGIEVFTRYEIQIQENQSFGAVDGSESIDTRFAEVGFKTPIGSLSLGKGEGAADGTAEGSYQVSGNILGGGHLPFFTVRGAINRDNPDAQVGYNYYDGFGRNSRLRYDTPSLGGLTLSASYATQERWEVAARLKRGLGPGKITVLGGYADSDNGDNDRTMFSGGYKFNFGLSFAASFSSRTQAGTDPDLESMLLSLNYQIGKLILSADVGEQGPEDSDLTNDVQQVGAEFKFSKATDIYGGYVNFDNADDTSVDTLFAGFRYKF